MSLSLYISQYLSISFSLSFFLSFLLSLSLSIPLSIYYLFSIIYLLFIYNLSVCVSIYLPSCLSFLSGLVWSGLPVCRYRDIELSTLHSTTLRSAPLHYAPLRYATLHHNNIPTYLYKQTHTHTHVYILHHTCANDTFIMLGHRGHRETPQGSHVARCQWNIMELNRFTFQV